MPGYVAVRVASLRKAEWCLSKARQGLAAASSGNRDDRYVVGNLLNEVLGKLRPLTLMAGPELELEVAWVRNVRMLASTVSSRIHSIRGLMIEDKRRFLGLVAAVKRELDPYIQLDLFSGP